MKATAYKLVVLAGALFLGACGGGEEGARLVPGVLEQYSDPAQVTAPDTVQAGEAFQIETLTYGGGCTSLGETRVTTSEGVVEIEPLDNEIEPDENEACTADLRMLDHSVEITLDTAGTTTVLVHGRREPGGEAITVERTITVE